MLVVDDNVDAADTLAALVAGSGDEVLARQLRARRGETVTLIAITGPGQDADRPRAAEAGFDHHLTKPVDHEELHRLLV